MGIQSLIGILFYEEQKGKDLILPSILEGLSIGFKVQINDISTATANGYKQLINAKLNLHGYEVQVIKTYDTKYEEKNKGLVKIFEGRVLKNLGVVTECNSIGYSYEIREIQNPDNSMNQIFHDSLTMI